MSKSRNLLCTNKIQSVEGSPQCTNMDSSKLQTLRGDLGPQYLAAAIANVLSFVYGLSIGWTAPVQVLLQANYTGTNQTSPLGPSVEPMTDEDFSWIGGTFCLGGVFGTSLVGYAANTIGRKKTLVATALPFVFSFGLMCLATNSTYLFVARVIGGIAAAGSCVIVPMYVGEIAEDQVRGVLGSLFALFICTGILASYVIGSYTSYMTLTLLCLIVTIIFMVLALWLPETPICLMLQDKRAEAFDSLLKLRGNHPDVVENQMATITASVKEMESSSVTTMSIKDMLTDPPTRKGLIIVLTVMTVQQAVGVAPILNYTVAIFNASGSQIPSSIATIIVGALQVVGAILATILMDRAGRKLLLMVSSIGMFFTLVPIAYFFHLKLNNADPVFLESIGFLPVTCLAIYIVVFALGFGPVPFVLVAELFKTEARSAATSMAVIQVWAVSFLFLKFFSNISNALGIDTCFGLFALACLGGSLFTAFYITETKGKSLEIILEELSGNTESDKSYKLVPLNDIGSTKTTVIETP